MYFIENRIHFLSHLFRWLFWKKIFCLSNNNLPFLECNLPLLSIFAKDWARDGFSATIKAVLIVLLFSFTYFSTTIKRPQKFNCQVWHFHCYWILRLWRTSASTMREEHAPQTLKFAPYEHYEKSNDFETRFLMEKVCFLDTEVISAVQLVYSTRKLGLPGTSQRCYLDWKIHQVLATS